MPTSYMSCRLLLSHWQKTLAVYTHVPNDYTIMILTSLVKHTLVQRAVAGLTPC